MSNFAPGLRTVTFLGVIRVDDPATAVQANDGYAERSEPLGTSPFASALTTSVPEEVDDPLPTVRIVMTPLESPRLQII